MMKKLNFLFCLFIIMILGSCSEESSVDELKPLKVSIVDGSEASIMLGETVSLEAKVENATTDTKGEWTLGEEMLSTATTYDFTPDKIGDFKLTYSAYTDNDRASADIIVHVSKEALTAAIANGSKISINMGESVVLDGVITNPSNEPISYEWKINGVGGNIAETEDFNFTPDTYGKFTIEFTARCGEETATASIIVNVLPVAVQVKSMDDIIYWVGEGEKRSALAIQWVNNTNESSDEPSEENVTFLCWGYRWNMNEEDKAPKGIDMLNAIAKDDSRLFVAVLGGTAYGSAILGFGYDANGDGKFAIKNASGEVVYTEDDFTDGMLEMSDYNQADGLTVASEGDCWQSGWMSGYNTYWLESGSNVPESFQYSSMGVSGRVLADNSWDAWTFSIIGGTNIEPYPQWLKTAIPLIIEE